MSRALPILRQFLRGTQLPPATPAFRQIHRGGAWNKTPLWVWIQRRLSGSKGDGSGKGGGSGGSIREAGGAFGKMEVAQEEKYFHDLQASQIKQMKGVMREALREKIKYHEKQLEAHNNGLKKHRELLTKDKNHQLHDIHISQHEEAIRKEEEAMSKIKDTWKKLHLEGFAKSAV